MPDKPKIYVYGICNVYYDGFYIKGLKEYFGVKRVYFSISKFPKFGYYDAMSVILKYRHHEVRLCIDSNDRDEIMQHQLDWCDVYGKVNYNKNALPITNSDKIKPIGPSFGIKIWNLPTTLTLCLTNCIRFYGTIPTRWMISNYRAQYQRLPLDTYFTNDASKPRKQNFIFFVSSIWKKEFETNRLRANFIYACKKISHLHFEGGFAPRSDGNNLTFDPIVLAKPYTLKKYMQKTKQSDIVFNTPVVDNCHGWKLGEFLALGKAILSTPLSNKMPVDLIDGEHILFLKEATEEDIQKNIQFLIDNEPLRLDMEKKSRQYFQDYLLPKKVVERLLNPAV